MIPTNIEKNTIQSVDRTFRIIEVIQERQGATLQELDSEFDIAKSTIHRHLNTLQKHGYVTREGSIYYIGLRFLDPAIHAQRRKSVYRLIEPKVDRLADETGERAQFITSENGLGIHIFSKVGENGIQSESRVGKLVYLHTTSVGKSILASLPKADVEAILDRYGLPELTSNTITDREELYQALDEIRRQRYATNKAERREGMMAIGTAVTTPDESVIGGISVTGPQRRMQEEHMEYLPDRLLDIAEEIRLRLEYPQS
ncbi:IclR family transcriptional regulator [Halobium palmae]|uniref:IclR family transcriptional regulator n=1 Tax=Halobium palmae TaxID=1776492 RepID=A0ABD5RVE2_9EURY